MRLLGSLFSVWASLFLCYRWWVSLKFPLFFNLLQQVVSYTQLWCFSCWKFSFGCCFWDICWVFILMRVNFHPDIACFCFCFFSSFGCVLVRWSQCFHWVVLRISVQHEHGCFFEMFFWEFWYMIECKLISGCFQSYWIYVWS